MKRTKLGRSAELITSCHQIESRMFDAKPLAEKRYYLAPIAAELQRVDLERLSLGFGKCTHMSFSHKERA